MHLSQKKHGKPTEPRGATLIEILVVISIVGLLVALILPAALQARESARISTCQNHLRQIGIAIQSYESANRRLPSLYHGNFLDRTPSALDEFHFHSWQAAVLPQLEEGALFDRIDFSQPATVPANLPNLQTQVSLFLCPSTNNPSKVAVDLLQWNDGQVPTVSLGDGERSDYEAIVATRLPTQTNAGRESDAYLFGAWGKIEYRESTLMLDSYRIPKLRHITDGLSKTLLVVERGGRPDEYEHGKLIDDYPYDVPQSGMDHHQAAWGVSTHFLWMVMSHGQKVNDTNATGIYGFHSSGANVVMADGSVDYLSAATDPSILSTMVSASANDSIAE